MHSEPWAVKNLNTLLGSWAQMRHTWTLQAKQSIVWVCATGSPSGFVEPEPEFFARLADLAAGTKKLLNESGALETDYQSVISDIRNFEEMFCDIATYDEITEQFHKLPSEDKARYLLGYGLIDMAPSATENVMEWLAAFRTDIEEGNMDQHPEIKRRLDSMNGELPEKWDDLERICRRLESIAHKELRGIPFSDSENIFLGDFGKELAGIMFYYGNSYLNPRDDAPRVIDVYSDLDTGQHLEVGVARARELLVLYPWQGQTYLCRGAIMPYYEFTSPARLNDAEWKALLDSEDRPAEPDWRTAIEN